MNDTGKDENGRDENEAEKKCTTGKDLGGSVVSTAEVSFGRGDAMTAETGFGRGDVRTAEENFGKRSARTAKENFGRIVARNIVGGDDRVTVLKACDKVGVQPSNCGSICLSQKLWPLGK